MIDKSDPNGEQVYRKYQEAKKLRQPHEGDWRDVAERLGIAGTLTGLNTTQSVLASARNPRNFIDAKAALAWERYGAMCEMMMTPRSQKWHGVKASDATLNKARRVKLYFETVRDRLFEQRYAPRSGFAVAQQETYASHGAFAFGIKFIEKPRERGQRGLRYRALDPSRNYILVDYTGRQSHNFREIDLNARQSAEQFGAENLPKQVHDELTKEGGPSETTMFRYIHMVAINDKRDPSRLDYKGMPISSCYVHEQSKVTVREGGYMTWPYPVARGVTTAEQVYARSIALKAMGAIKTANEIKVTLLKQGHRTVDPVLLGYDDGVLDSFDMRPGAYNAGGVNAEGKELVKTLPVGRVDVGVDMLDREHKDINDFFYVTLFLMLMETPEMTATEVVQKLRERGALLAPVMGKIEDEDLSVTVEREIDLLDEQGMLPEMPPELVEARGEYTLTFDNPFSRAQQGDEVAGFMRTTDWAINIAATTKDTRPLRRLNFDAAMPEIAERQNVPSRWLHSDDEMAAMQEQDEQQQGIQTAIEAAPAIAGLAKAQGAMNGSKQAA